MLKNCGRCGIDQEPSEIGLSLAHYICDGCRTDIAGWEFNGIRLIDMEYQSAEPKDVVEKRQSNYENEKYS